MAAFLLRGIYLAVALPFGDPLDEPFHLGYAMFIAATGRPPAVSEPSLSTEWIRASLNMPQPAVWGEPSTTYSQFMELPPAEQSLRRRGAFSPHEGERTDWRLPNYEAQQAPLAYLVVSPTLRGMAGAGIDRCLLALRIVGTVIACVAVPIVFVLLRAFLAPRTALAGTAAYVAFPGIGMFVGRFTNDQLALPIAAALLLLLVDIAEGRLSRPRTVALTLLLAAGLWTKLYLLAMLPAALTAAALSPPGARRRTLTRAAAAVALSALLFLPWELRQKSRTGHWYGDSETAAARSAQIGPAEVVRETPRFLRPKNVAAFAKSFVWPGTWTWIGAPWPAAALLGIAFATVLIGARRFPARPRRRALAALGIVLVLFLAEQVVHAATFEALARRKHSPAVAGYEGWYLLVLAPVFLVAAAALGRPRPASYLALATAGVAADAALLLGLLPACYAFDFQRHQTASFDACLGLLLHPGRALQVWNAVSLGHPGTIWLAVLLGGWATAMATGIWLAARARRVSLTEDPAPSLPK